GVRERPEDARRDSRLVGHALDRHLGLRGVVRDARDDRLLQQLVLLDDPGALAVVERRAHVEPDTVVPSVLDRAQDEDARPASSASRTRSMRISTILALPCDVSVTIPACEPVNETASRPRSLIAIERSAIEIRSPAVRSMSSSRGCGRGETCSASVISSSVVWPIAETATQTSAPFSAVATTRRATSRIRSGSPTEVPPNFWTS